MSKNPSDYPISAEQYLIANYEQALSDNRKLVIENKVLSNKLSFYEHTQKGDENVANKLKVLPTLVAHHFTDYEYNYKDYNLTPDKYDELVAYLKVLESNPKNALSHSNICRVRVNDLNIKVEIYGLVRYGRAYTGYNDSNKLELSFVDEVKTFEQAYDELIKEIKKHIKSWNDTYLKKWQDKQKPKED